LYLLLQCKKYGYDFNGELDFWDMRYYNTMIEETKYSVDQETLKEYFPAKTVIDGSLEIYQRLLGLKFVECKEDIDKWHDEVQLVKLNEIFVFKKYLKCSIRFYL